MKVPEESLKKVYFELSQFRSYYQRKKYILDSAYLKIIIQNNIF